MTKRGVPVVKLQPASKENNIFSFMAGEFRIVGDIESPVTLLRQSQGMRGSDRKDTNKTKKRGEDKK